MSSTGHPGTRCAPIKWQRFTPAQRLMRYGVYLAIVAAVVQSARTVRSSPSSWPTRPSRCRPAGAHVADRLGHYPQGVHEALVGHAAHGHAGHDPGAGDGRAAGAAGGAGNVVTRNRALNFWRVCCWCPAARSTRWSGRCCSWPSSAPGRWPACWPSPSARWASWASCWARRSNKPTRPDRGAAGRRRALAAQIWYGYWPQVKPAFWSIVLFRWDINVRESGVLGLVGAGGIGMALDTAINLFQWTAWRWCWSRCLRW
jgi:phosphonate transport system permease protein